jgi:hypothetical protein
MVLFWRGCTACTTAYLSLLQAEKFNRLAQMLSQTMGHHETEVSYHISTITCPIPLIFVSLSHACNSVMIRLPTFFQRLIFHSTRRILANPFPNQSLNVSVATLRSIAWLPPVRFPLLMFRSLTHAILFRFHHLLSFRGSFFIPLDEFLAIQTQPTSLWHFHPYCAAFGWLRQFGNKLS